MDDGLDDGMDDGLHDGVGEDPVPRRLAVDLARDDPRLAALLLAIAAPLVVCWRCASDRTSP